jgi:hypothetical protein
MKVPLLKKILKFCLDRICMATGNPETPRFDKSWWIEEILNAGVLAGITFFTTISVTQDIYLGLKIGLIQAGITFFTRLAFIRGLKK